MNPDFQQNVYKIVRLIPKGRVCSYGVIGKALGMATSARMVGRVMNEAHTQKEYVPAHRVVNRVGVLTGKHHFSSLNQMQELLESEGVMVENDKIVNFKQHFWDPFIELNLE